jgi:hypothetical protein
MSLMRRPFRIQGVHGLRGDSDFGAGGHHEAFRSALAIDEHIFSAADI